MSAVLTDAGAASLLDSPSVTEVIAGTFVVVTVIGAYLTAKRTGQSNKETAEISTRDTGWSLITREQREEIKALRESRSEDEQRFRNLEERLEATEKKSRRLAHALRDLQTKYVASVQHVKEWTIWSVAQSGPPPRLPAVLAHDVDDPPILREDEL